MSNFITCKNCEHIQMSNGLTAVFFDVMALAASELAATVWEKKLAYWFVEHDQSVNGLGIVGFDVSEMGWEVENFTQQKQFIYKLIEAALTKPILDKLDFQPNMEWLALRLEKFKAQIESFAYEPPKDGSWIPSSLPTYGKCAVHNVYLHQLGCCIICNDSSIDIDPQPYRN